MTTEKELLHPMVQLGSGLGAAAGEDTRSVTAELDEVPAHLLAGGKDAPQALTLAADNGEKLVSLILVDPQVDETDAAFWALLRRISVPTLVIAAAPDPSSPVAQAQAIAGGIENGVFVIIDGIDAPSHRTRPASVKEWGSAFMEIAENLALSRLRDPS